MHSVFKKIVFGVFTAGVISLLIFSGYYFFKNFEHERCNMTYMRKPIYFVGYFINRYLLGN